ncbi:MAG TPA: hypothetical protein VJ931_09145 [Actinomycetota bacterium]|nr:hypothetical protein [Actinomycetota bacterium]
MSAGSLWECQRHDCTRTASGAGGAIGLRAIGWHVAFRPGTYPEIRCPAHRPDSLPATDELYHGGQANGQPCSPCAAEAEALHWQRTILEGWLGGPAEILGPDFHGTIGEPPDPRWTEL